MAIGRIFPIPNPDRSFPSDPTLQGETGRNAPLPFQLGSGGAYTVETLYEIKQLLQTYVFVPVDPTIPTGGGGTGAGCSPSNNQNCVPRATMTLAAPPVASVTCIS